jgi:hypothetical protein
VCNAPEEDFGNGTTAGCGCHRRFLFLVWCTEFTAGNRAERPPEYQADS